MKYTGMCHCNAVKFKFDADVKELVRCDCSLCSKRAALMISVDKTKLEIVEGQDAVREYRWNTEVARLYFCGTCGIYVFHQRRSNPSMFSVNANCVEGLDIERLPVRHVDGKNRSATQLPVR